MKTIKITYGGIVFEVQIKRVKADPYDVFEIEFSNNSELISIMESPAFITEKSDLLSLPEVQNINQRKLLMSFAEGIKENYPI